MRAQWQHRVLPEEVDAFGVVHFSNYVKWCSAAMMELFAANGLGPGQFDEGRVEVRVGRMQVVYASSARLSDKLTVSVPKVTLQKKSLVLQMRIGIAEADGSERVAARAKLTIAFVEAASGKLTDAPEDVKAAFGEGVQGVQDSGGVSVKEGTS
jgi:acyl-CoA thioester hydrolase